ncbi:hypothetical protein FSP39_003770 [Pinctada imbricata]|uniref:PKD domain-containing protein n=1 Tax=Pinctada imbricata TaxID=66713 RepID=A0AA88Y7Y8_PINIB|nr:hypothetical protein FSP39_003770 [Pinctada imbricata]
MTHQTGTIFLSPADNHVSNVTWDFYIPIQVPIEGLEIAATPTIPFGTNRNIPISLTAGSHTDIVITWNGTSLNESYFNWHTLYGEAVVQSNHYDSNGRFFVSANVTNLVSPYVTFTREVWVDYMITDLLIFLDRPFVPVGEKTTFDIYMSHCSRFDTFVNFSDGSSLQHFYHDLLLNETYSAQHIFSFPGRYVVNLTISNDVDYYNDQYNIVVQYPVVNVESFIMPTTRLEPGMNAPAYLQMEFMGGVPLATNATYTISFDDGTTFLDDFIEIFPGTLSYSNKETTESSLLTLSLCDSSFNSSFPLNDTSLVAFLEQCNMTVTTAATVLDSNTTEPVSTTEATTLGGYFLIPITHYYTAIGTYNITINVTNLVSFMFFSFIVDVDEPIYNLQLLPNPVHLKTFSSSDLEVRMSWGSRAVCTWIIGDGTPPIEAPCDRHSVALQTQTFNTVGVYHPKIIANNTVSYEFNTSSVGPIYVQDPVVGFLVECTSLTNGKCERDIDGPSYSVDVEFQLLFEKFNRKPTNASYIIDFGDGFVTSPAELSNSHETVDFTIKNGSFYNLVFDFSHTYTRGGNYSVKVIIWNLVSNETYEVFHDIYEKIEDLDMMIHSYDPDTLNKKIGGGPGRDYFALEREVLFEAKHSRGSHVTYDWTFGDGTPSVAFYYDKRASKKYNQDISYIVSLDASNIRNSMSIERRIYIQRGCFNISISVDEPRAKNSTFRYQVFPGSIGTDACYLLDFSDETSIPGQYQMFGDENQCGNVTEWSQYFENDNTTFTTVSSDDLYHKKTVSSPNNYNLTIDTMFMTEGLYDVTLQCQNLVSHETAEFSTGVTSGPCWWPYVNLTAPNICEYPECDPVVPGLRNIKRSERLVVYSEVRINCTATDVSWYSWRVYKVDEVTQIEEEIFDLGETDTYSIACRYLQIEPRILDYGLYRFELNVSMHEEMGMFTLDSAYIKITSTPLQVRIAGGDFFTGKWGTFEPMIFDGMSEVFDPDVDPDDKSEMEFIWLCRRYCESWPQFDSNYDVPDPFTMVTDCASYVEESDRGCFRRDQVNHAGKIINATSGMLEIMTGELYEGEEVEIRLIVRKDGREAEDSALALILTGDPPEIYLTCVTNCDQKMNPTNRYSLKSSMRGWTRGVFFYYE